MADLRERHFGPSYELMSHEKVSDLYSGFITSDCTVSIVVFYYINFLFILLNSQQYQEIWALDEKDPFQRTEGGESVDDVASRLGRAMALMELEFEGYAIALHHACLWLMPLLHLSIFTSIP